MKRTRAALWALFGALLLWLGLAAWSSDFRLGAGWWTVAALAVAAVAVQGLAGRLARRVARGTVLELDLTGGVGEKRPDSLLARLRPSGGLVLRDVSDALRRAAGDRRVAGLIARIGAGGIGPAATEEIRAAVAAFRGAGKRAVAFAESLGEGGNGTLGVWLASAFDEAWLQPMGDVSLVGLRLRTPFLRGFFERLGVVPSFGHRKEYKSAKYVLTEREMPAPQREESERLLDSILGEVVAGIAAGRGLPEAEVRALVDRGPFLGEEAIAAKLVDGHRYRDEVVDAATDGRQGRLLDLGVYLRRAGRPDRKGPAIAIVTATGAIESGRGRWRPFPAGHTMGSDDVTEALRAARKSKKVRAILFRVDSPGGSAVASEAIRREIVLAGKEGKPVVATMGNVAGSGGYWISMAAARIVARPTTLTGSIGVVWGKFVTAGAFGKAGIRTDGVERGEHAGMWAADRDFTEEERARLEVWLDAVYDEFVDRVAADRGLDRAAAEAVAKGRVWTGRDAHARGLVDVLGGFPEALAAAREAAGIAAEKPVRVVTFPRRGRFARLFRKRESSEDVAAAFAALAGGVALPGPVYMDLPLRW